MSSQSCDRLTFSGYNPTHPAQYNTSTTFPQTVGIFLLFFCFVCNTLLKNFSQQYPKQTAYSYSWSEGTAGPGAQSHTRMGVLLSRSGFFFLAGWTHSPDFHKPLRNFQAKQPKPLCSTFTVALFFLPLAIFHFAAYLLKSKKRKKWAKAKIVDGGVNSFILTENIYFLAYLLPFCLTTIYFFSSYFVCALFWLIP